MIKNGIYGYYDIKKGQIVYIGQSKDILSRHSDHIKPSRYNQQAINRILQNNPDRYKLVIIRARSGFSKQDRDILEKHYIEFYNTFRDKDKFNYTSGGDFCPSMIPEIARKISKANRGKHRSEETIEKMRKAKIGQKNPMYRKHHSEETIEKMRKANIGKKIPDKTQKKMSLSQNNSIGYRRVCLDSCPRCKSGKMYKYQYYNDDGERKAIRSTNLEKLKEKVLKRGLPWEKLN